jgi:hypothetical protein
MGITAKCHSVKHHGTSCHGTQLFKGKRNELKETKVRKNTKETNKQGEREGESNVERIKVSKKHETKEK